jgi:hypothetical protein
MHCDTIPAAHGIAPEVQLPTCHPEAKWMALVDDEPVSVPQRHVLVEVIKSQAGVPCDSSLVRDFNSQNDPALNDQDAIDLADGNVFYRLRACDQRPKVCGGVAPAKLAFFVDDRAELTVNPHQTGHTLRELFGLSQATLLFRDFESSLDEPIAPGRAVSFLNGPVFYTRHHDTALTITVNSRRFTGAEGVKARMHGEEIATLVYPLRPRETRVWLRGAGDDREIGLEEEVKIHGCEVFDVVRRKVDGGHELARVEREIGLVNAKGTEVKLISAPSPAVIYRGLRTAPGYPIANTDVLVPVPAGYPGQFIDWAYLPEGSPLIGRVAGSPQSRVIRADGRTWRQVSYHPHNGGGGASWDPTVHGFHTYAGELIAWLYNAR